MANKLTLSAVGLFSLLAAGTFAQTATTDPVGFIKISIPGAPAGGESYAYPALSLVRAQEYRGVITSNTATVITDSAATWSDNQFNGSGTTPTHYVEILTGANAGATFDISATTATTKAITVAASFAANALNGQSYRIRKHWTLGAVFGAANEIGLTGGTATTADLVHLWNGTSYVVYYYRVTAGGAVGWRSAGDTVTNQANAVVFPEDGIFLKKRGTTALSLVVVGDVRTGADQMAVSQGYNLLNPASPVDIRLSASGLFTGSTSTGMKPGTPSTADMLQIWTGSGFNVYYMRQTALGLVGWRLAGDTVTDQANAVIPAGASVILKRQADVPSFVWNRPQPY